MLQHYGTVLQPFTQVTTLVVFDGPTRPTAVALVGIRHV